MLISLQRGFTLIEFMIGLLISAVLLAVGAPSFIDWVQNGQIRNSAEAIQNGLQLARAEAVRRNTTVRFQLTSSVTSDCAVSTTGRNWVVSQDDPTGACGSTPSDVTAPRIVQVRTSAEGSANAVVTADQAAFVFNGLGRLTPVAAGDLDIDITNPNGGECQPAGSMRCLRVRVSPGGQLRMCDPTRGATDPQGC